MALGRGGRTLGKLGGRLSLFAGAPSGSGGCYVHANDQPAGGPDTLEEYVDLSLDDLRSDGGIEVGEVTRSRADLAAGPSEVLDVGFAREYLLMHEGMFYAFGCFVPDGAPPEDRWLPIAQTIEFLTEES